jgi:hypothetical protein
MMTDLAAPPRAAGPARDEADDHVPPRYTGIVGLYTAMMVAIGAATVGLVVITALVLVAWGADSGGQISAVTALRAACQAWLLAHHSPIGTDSGTIGLVPIGLMALPIGLLARAGILLGRANAPIGLLEAARLVLALAATYGLVAALLSFGTGSSVAQVGSLSAVLGAVVVAAVAAGVGVLHGAELTGPLLARLPGATPVVLRAAALAVAVLLCAGGLLVGAALAMHGGQTVALAHALGGGVVGGVMVCLLCVLYAPNAVVCGLSYAVGPGFAVGSGTSVTAFGAHLGPVPAFPLLGALPAGTRAAPMSWPILLAPLVAGVLAGLVLGRSPRGGARAVFGCAALAGVCVGALAALAGGPLGAGRLAAVGPSPWRVGGAVFAELAVVALTTAFFVRRGAEPADLPAALPVPRTGTSEADSTKTEAAADAATATDEPESTKKPTVTLTVKSAATAKKQTPTDPEKREPKKADPKNAEPTKADLAGKSEKPTETDSKAVPKAVPKAESKADSRAESNAEAADNPATESDTDAETDAD